MRIKKTIVTKDIGEFMLDESVIGSYVPKAGDVGLFEIVTLGRHEQIQGEEKRERVEARGQGGETSGK